MNKRHKVPKKENEIGCWVGWTQGAPGFRQRLTRIREWGGGTGKQQAIVLIHQALGDTLKHIHSFTH